MHIPSFLIHYPFPYPGDRICISCLFKKMDYTIHISFITSLTLHRLLSFLKSLHIEIENLLRNKIIESGKPHGILYFREKI